MRRSPSIRGSFDGDDLLLCVPGVLHGEAPRPSLARLGPVLTIDAKHNMTPQEWLAFCNAMVIQSPSSSQTG